MTMAQAMEESHLSAPFDFDFEKLNIGTAQRQRGDILATRRISIRDGSELVSALWGNLWGIFEKSQQSLRIKENWRRRRDSNPRYGF